MLKVLKELFILFLFNDIAAFDNKYHIWIHRLESVNLYLTIRPICQKRCPRKFLAATFHGKGDKVSCYSTYKATGSDSYYIAYGVW